MPTSHLIAAIAATAELCGKVFSPAAAKLMAEDLGEFPEHAVMRALARCRKEITTGGGFTLGAVIARIDDGRPGADEAWAMLPRTEADTAVWTEEMAEAWRIALPLIRAGEMIPARMAFREAYWRECQHARELARACVWRVTPGTDPQQRELVITAAREAGRISPDVAALFLPLPAPDAAGITAVGRAGLRALRGITGGKP